MLLVSVVLVKADRELMSFYLPKHLEPYMSLDLVSHQPAVFEFNSINEINFQIDLLKRKNLILVKEK